MRCVRCGAIVCYGALFANITQPWLLSYMAYRTGALHSDNALAFLFSTITPSFLKFDAIYFVLQNLSGKKGLVHNTVQLNQEFPTSLIQCILRITFIFSLQIPTGPSDDGNSLPILLIRQHSMAAGPYTLCSSEGSACILWLWHVLQCIITVHQWSTCIQTVTE